MLGEASAASSVASSKEICLALDQESEQATMRPRSSAIHSLFRKRNPASPSGARCPSIQASLRHARRSLVAELVPCYRRVARQPRVWLLDSSNPGSPALHLSRLSDCATIWGSRIAACFLDVAHAACHRWGQRRLSCDNGSQSPIVCLA